MKVQEFLVLIQKNVNRVKVYKLGGDGTNGECDCIGLIIGALRMGGVKWPWTHGSNYTARSRMRWMKPLDRLSDLRLGQLVYKAKDPGDSGYALPDKYKSGDDLRDYYHVGVVTNTSPVVITNCTGVAGGIQYAKTLGNWNWYGEMDLVEYGEEALDMAKYMVTGGTLNMRKGPGYQYDRIDGIPDGTVIDAAPDANAPGWMRVEYDGQSGYAMDQYLVSVVIDEPALDESETVSVTVNRLAAEMLLAALETALK